jgi:hypothetical protein
MSAKKRRAAKQGRQATQDEFAGLKRKLQQLPLGDDGEVVVVAGGEVKMSEVLTDFVEHFAPSTRTGNDYRMLLQLGALAWNASFLSGDQQEQMISDLLANGMPAATVQERLELKRMLHALIDRRQSEFAEHKRLIVGMDWKETSDGGYFSVASTLDT